MIFNDQNKLSGFTIPMKDKAKLKEKFNIDNNFWITKSGDGYFMADFKMINGYILNCRCSK